MIDGKPAPLRRCDYLFQGIVITPGLHEVTLHYSVPTGPLLLQAGGFALCVLALGLLVVGRSKLQPVQA